ncbi:P-loop containing nucleoside triphosphate hydrolase protein [Hypoxylon sp. NC0597]|nr:P-loop containing nucleoside triphosphate hydrolase protein [Hypoxylon sp. NC0597]
MASTSSFVPSSLEAITEGEVMVPSKPQTPPVPHSSLTKTFSFAIPKAFRTSNTIDRWIDDVPNATEATKRDEPLGRGSFLAHKQALLEAENPSQGHDEDGRVGKQPQKISALDTHQGPEKQGTGGNFKSRLSAAWRLITTSREHREAMKRFSIDLSPSFGSTNSNDPNREKMRFIIVGDSGCGKSNLLLRYSRDVFDQDHIKTQYELFNKTTVVNNREVDLEIWDTSGELGLHQLELLSYMSWDTVFLCYGMDKVDVFMESQTTWVDQIRKNCGDIPVVLVGLKKDTRKGKGVWAPLRPELRARLCSHENEYGDVIMRAMKYVECSALTGENVHRLFDEAVQTVLADRIQEEEIARIRERFEEDDTNSFAKLMCFK